MLLSFENGRSAPAFRCSSRNLGLLVAVSKLISPSFGTCVDWDFVNTSLAWLHSCAIVIQVVLSETFGAISDALEFDVLRGMNSSRTGLGACFARYICSCCL